MKIETSQWLEKNWGWVETGSTQFQNALRAITETEDNLFICGPGGVGKSILLQMTYDFYPNCIVMGSTGISAANLVADGVPSTTVHSALKLPPISVLDKSVKINQDASRLLGAASVVLIDEISMINASLMDYILKVALKGSDYHIPRFILFGDIFQLPPVKDRDKDVRKYFEKTFDGNYFFFNSKLYKNFNFQTIHLDEVYRQKDPEFKTHLNAIRLGVPSKENLDYFNKQVIDSKTFIANNELMMYLASTNKRVEDINWEYTRNPQFTVRQSYYAEVEGDFSIINHPFLKEEVEIAVGQQVMCLFNNPAEGYQNGTIGKVVELHPDCVLVEKSDGRIVRVREERWTKYQFIYNEVKNEIDHMETGYCSQIGCKPAFSVTLHKSQGLTLDAVYIDLSSQFIPDAGIYLALSRCRTIEGIGLSRPLTRADIKINAEALEFFAETADFDEE